MSPLLYFFRKYADPLLLLLDIETYTTQNIWTLSLSFKFYLFLHQTNLICGAHIFLDVCSSTGVWLISKNLYSQRKLIISLLAIINF